MASNFIQRRGRRHRCGIRDCAQCNRDLLNLENIDVLRGSASMLFGRGTTGSVINQASKRPFLSDSAQIDDIQSYYTAVGISFNPSAESYAIAGNRVRARQAPDLLHAPAKAAADPCHKLQRACPASIRSRQRTCQDIFACR